MAYRTSCIEIIEFLLQPRFGGKIIDIVSRDLQTHKQQSEAWNDVKDTIIEIFLVVVVGYDHYLAQYTICRSIIL